MHSAAVLINHYVLFCFCRHDFFLGIVIESSILLHSFMLHGSSQVPSFRFQEGLISTDLIYVLLTILPPPRENWHADISICPSFNQIFS